MELPTLYKRTKTGAIQEWTIQAENGATRTIHGQVGGKLITSEWYEARVTNEGRSNQRDPQEQAEFEARKQWTDRTKKDYFEDINAIDKVIFKEPMRAHKYPDALKKGKLQFPVYVSPKLDGNRATIDSSGAFSRGNKPWVSIPHILEALKPIFEKYPNLKLDGELYAHEFHDNFNKISSLIKRKNMTPKDIELSKKYIRFHLYDICDETMVYSERLKFIAGLLNEFDLQGSVELVNAWTAYSEEDVNNLHSTFLGDGYEGSMIRQDTPYEFERSWSLLKFKDWNDEEFKVIDIIEGKGNKKGLAVKAILQMENGKEFPSTIKERFPILKEIWENKNQYIGKYATCKYFELTPEKDDGTGGVPRFSNCDRFRNAPGSDD